MKRTTQVEELGLALYEAPRLTYVETLQGMSLLETFSGEAMIEDFEEEGAL